jgi:threonine dehydrogenase-like Zn-dependent dehydrogenase
LEPVKGKGTLRIGADCVFDSNERDEPVKMVVQDQGFDKALECSGTAINGADLAADGGLIWVSGNNGP